jgi:TPR repeat protein
MHYLDLDMKQGGILSRIFGILRGIMPGSQTRILNEGTKRKYATAFYELGVTYAEGKYGIRPNMYKALQYLEKAISMGDTTAQIELARIFMQEGKNGQILVEQFKF